MRKICWVIILGLFLCGCGKSDEPGAVDYLTGKEQLKVFQKAKSKIEEINERAKERNEYEDEY